MDQNVTLVATDKIYIHISRIIWSSVKEHVNIMTFGAKYKQIKGY